MADELDRYLGDLSAKLRRELDAVVRRQADELVRAMQSEVGRSANPGPHTGKLQQSVRNLRQGTARYLVVAGGDETTVRGYDYALAKEFGTSRQQAEPFFFTTYNRMKADIQETISRAVEDIMGKA